MSSKGKNLFKYCRGALPAGLSYQTSELSNFPNLQEAGDAMAKECLQPHLTAAGGLPFQLDPCYWMCLTPAAWPLFALILEILLATEDCFTVQLQNLLVYSGCAVVVEIHGANQYYFIVAFTKCVNYDCLDGCTILWTRLYIYTDYLVLINISLFTCTHTIYTHIYAS